VRSARPTRHRCCAGIQTVRCSWIATLARCWALRIAYSANLQSYSEDRTTYEGRTGSNRLPYDAILCHELGHSYIGSESLTQFLELYAYNVIRTGSTDPQAWIFTRGWTPNLPANQDVAAVLDIYRLIGHDAMRRAYRAIYPLRPPYGQPLSQTVIQAFVAQVPVTLQAQVAEKLAKITF